MSLGQTIERLRKKRQLTQVNLAQNAGITQAYLSSIENDKKDPNVSTLEAIAGGLNVPLPVLFFLSLDPKHVSEGKRELLETFKPLMESLVEEFL